MAKFTGTDLPQLSNGSDDVAVKKSILDLLDKINSVANAQYPVGYVYTQYPGTSDPATLFGGTWLNITSLYAGLFFRAEGGSSLAFNAGNQLDAFQGHVHDWSGNTSGGGGNGNSGIWGVTNVNNAGSGISTPRPDGTNGTPRTASETRPVNTTIRIWQRSGGTLTTTTGTSVTMGIYDSGTNSNGSWIRFTDGTMQCWKDTVGPMTISLGPGTGGLYYTPVSATFPQQFISKPTVTSQIGNRITPNIAWVGWIDTTTTGISGELVSFVLNFQTYWQYIAIGKWK